MDIEQPLRGGAQSHGIVRVGATVRRDRHARSDFTQAVLRHLESVGFAGAPRALGFDEQGREVVSFVEGHVFHDAIGTPDSGPAPAASTSRTRSGASPT